MKTTERRKKDSGLNRTGVWIIYCIGFAIVALQLRSMIG